jgi:shikimate dehydrogenase
MASGPPISATTRLCAVIGNPIGHSLSPAIHNAAFAACGLDYVYTAFRVDDVGAALAGMRSLENFHGLSVTIPHKREVLRHVDEVPAVDRRIGSINTVVKEGGRLLGFGTDGPAALAALREAGADPAGRRVLLLGAGGAARAIAFSLLDRAGVAGLTLLDIDAAGLRTLASDLTAAGGAPVTADPLDDASLRTHLARTDILVQCTPVGMHPRIDATLVPAALLHPGLVVFDIVYNPHTTRLLTEAAAAGCTVIPGVEMFLHQAVLQFERFTGVAAPVAVMRAVVLARLGA